MKDLVIVGSGGLGREVMWLIEECNCSNPTWNVLGWVSQEPVGTLIADKPVLGNDNWLVQYKKEINVVIALGDVALRKRVVDKIKCNHKISFPTIVSPKASLSDSVHYGIGCIVTSQCVLTVDICVGDFFVCNLLSTIGHDCIIGDYVTVNPGSHISGGVIIGDCVSVGTGVNVLQNLQIAEGAVVGAGAVVTKNVEKNSVVVGVPAHLMEKK